MWRCRSSSASVVSVGSMVAMNLPKYAKRPAMPSTVEQLTEAIEGVLRHAPGAGVIVGGSGAPDSFPAFAGVVACRHVGDAVELTDGLLHRSALN